MKITNASLEAGIDGSQLTIKNLTTNQELQLNWPAVTLSLNGRQLAVQPGHALSEPAVSDLTIQQQFRLEEIDFTISISLQGDAPWVTKHADIQSQQSLPTPDYLDMDDQVIPADNLSMRGYMPLHQREAQKGEEEGSGRIPGCGYPLIGDSLFIGLEHPAGFNSLESSDNGSNHFRLRHYPIWEGAKLQAVDAVIGLSANPEETFAAYLDSIRIPALTKPLISFCTFWSDPYLGDNEYDVTYEAYEKFFKAFIDFGLVPDVLTLDAGWNKRKSIFQLKDEAGGDEGLQQLADLTRQHGSNLSLWLSHNGPMGICPEHLTELGMEVGAGPAAAYSGSGYGVMMDDKFANALEERFCELIEKIGAIHFKIDWDNEGATNDKFKEVFPTADHVRQASLNVFFRIADTMRRKDPNVVIRNGWWPSPWWLKEANHVWLTHSGDSEFSGVPSKNMRESASTHRDAMYYYILQRDKTPVPLDCFDNHEFPDALRNPFCNDPVSWSNAVWLSFFRGSTYLAYTVNPEAMEEWQIKCMHDVMEFSRIYADKIFVKHGRMILGNPAMGEIYGFLLPGEKESWCIMRNPLPIPQKQKINLADFTPHSGKTQKQFYPCFASTDFSKELTFAAHEIKIFSLAEHSQPLPLLEAFTVEKEDDHYLYRFPASLTISEAVKPKVAAIQQLHELKCDRVTGNRNDDGSYDITWELASPYRMRDFELQFSVEGEDLSNLGITAKCARYMDIHAAYTLPVTEVPHNTPGYGESKNSDDICSPDKRFYAITIPDSGNVGVRLSLSGINPDNVDLQVWAAGYEAPSRNGVVMNSAPVGFAECLPYQHPLGFARTLQLPLP